MKDKLKALLNKPLVLLAAAAVLLVIGTVGSTQAALTYYSEDYVAQVDVPNVGVEILENGTAVDKLLVPIGDITVGKTYDEILTAKNTGAADSYLRVIVKKYWTDKEGKKDLTLSPKYIELGFVDFTSSNWILDTKASTSQMANEGETTVLYYKLPVASGVETTNFTETIRIDEAFETTVEVDTKTNGNFTTITYTHPFDEYQFHIEVEADSVQLFNAQDAILSEWGVAVNIDTDGTLSLVNP